MAIQINPVDLRGFALGGGNTPQLPNIGALGLQALQMRMNQQDQAAQLAAQERMNMARVRSSDEAMLQQNLLDRDKLDVQQNQFNQNYNLDKNKLGLLQAQNNAENTLKQQSLADNMTNSQNSLGMQQQQLAFQQQQAQQQAAMEQMKLGVQQLAAKKKDDLDKMGSFAVQALTSLDKVSNPQDANILRNDIVDEAISSGYVPQEYGKQLKQMSLSQFKQATGMLAFQADKAKDLQDMLKAQNPKAGGAVTVTTPDGQVIQVNPLTTPVQTELQKDVISKDQTMTQFDKLAKDYNPDYFTYANQAAAKLSKEAEKWKGTPGADQISEFLAKTITGESPEQRSQFLDKRSQYMNNVDQVFNAYRKDITGAAAGEKEMDQLKATFLNGDMSPSEFKGSLEMIRDKYKSQTDASKQALANGGLNTSTNKILKYNPETGRLE